MAVLGLWLFLDANQFRPQLESAMGGALGRKVSIGNIKIALFSGGMAIDDLSIADDPAFSTAPFVTAKAVTVGVDLMPLIFSRSLHVKSFRLEDPQVVLLNSSSGQWNFSGLGSRGRLIERAGRRIDGRDERRDPEARDRQRPDSRRNARRSRQGTRLREREPGRQRSVAHVRSFRFA